MIDKEIDALSKWLNESKDFQLPSFKELPTVPLYMEQVVSYINDTLSPLLSEDDASKLTSFMVNNYVKAKIIKEPERKKYNEEHLGYLLAICFLKRTLSMSELSLLIQMDADASSDKSALYRFFSNMLADITHDVALKSEFHLEDFHKVYGNLSKKDPEKASKFMADSLALMALRLSIKASVYRLISKRLLASVSAIEAGIPLPDENAGISKKERKRAEKNATSEAERVALYVEKGKKKKIEEASKKAEIKKKENPSKNMKKGKGKK